MGKVRRTDASSPGRRLRTGFWSCGLHRLGGSNGRDGLSEKCRINGMSAVVVSFEPVGDAPPLKQSIYRLAREATFMTVISFLRKQLMLEPTDSLFLFVNQVFQPTPEVS